MAKELYNTKATKTGTGIHTDNSPLEQPKGTSRFILNGVNETGDGKRGSISNDRSNRAVTAVPDGYDVIGERYLGDDTLAIISVNRSNFREEIGLLDKDDVYKTVVNTSVLTLRIEHQCDIVYRLRRGKERVIYWVNGNNQARTFNFDRPYNFYSEAYQNYIRAGNNPDTYTLERWDKSSFDLIKTYNAVPYFSNVEVLETGATLPGSYNFSIHLVDEDLNPTEWITTSNTVNIYNDSTNNPYHRIRGSRNLNTDAQSFGRASKSIKLTITNLDRSFPYYRVAVIRAAGNTGKPEKVLVSDLFSTSDSIFIYTGNDGALTETALEDILIDKEVIFAPQHIEQIENKLLLANTQGKNMPWCDFQKFASKVRSDLTTKEIFLNSILSEGNVKNPKSTFFYRGYMPGEVYAFGIVYLCDDGTLSPVFHIPGRSSATTGSDMVTHELTTKYLDVHNCSTSNYWGVDANGDTLTGKNVRHHRFAFRKDVNKPLYTTNTSTTNINKYRLKVTITLNPAWTPGPIEYPTAGSPPLPVVINYGFKYKVDSSPTTDTFTGQITDSDMGQEILIYDDVTPLDFVTGSVYSQLDPTSQLAVDYNPGTNDRFLITESYTSYVVDSIVNVDSSEIFGIEFSNIEKPHPDIVGFYIVRCERIDDDKMIVDNAVFGPMTTFEQYKSFGLIMPKQFYTANNCGTIGNAGKTLQYYENGMWVFNPEFQFFNKKIEYDQIEIEGTYTETAVNIPVISNSDTTCNTGKSKGVYINDVQAGTSYNPDVNKKKDKDDDGFDLLIGYRNTNVAYSINNITVIPDKRRIIHLTAAAYQNFEANTYYNVSVDNKIGMYLTDEGDLIPSSTFYDTGTTKNKLLYGSLVKSNQNVYTNFITRAYYKEHNNPVMFGNVSTINNVEIFNGDAQISALHMISTVFYDMVVADRAKKSKVWKIIAGAVLIVVGVVVGIFTAGAGLSISAIGAGVLAGLAISYGVSLAMSGIKFEQFKSMVDVDYEKGLKETVVDGGVFETIRDTIEKDDDTIRWFGDRVSNVYIESSVPFGLRSGLTCGVPDFMDAPAPYDEAAFRTYLTEKLTIVDRDQGSGRMYKGYATAEFYDMNLDYMRFNKEKIFFHLPLEYDCCSDSNELFPTRVWWSETSFQEEKIDNYRVFLPNNYRDIEGEHGEITDLYRLGNSLFIHTKEALWQLPQNLQERVTSEIVSFIGTGEFFNIPPRKVLDDNLGSAGSQHKWATIKTNRGVFFISEIEKKPYLHGEGIKEISAGNSNWFENNMKPNISKQIFDKFGFEFLHVNNPANSQGVGYLAGYDRRFNRIMLTKKDYSILPEKLAVLELSNQIPLGGNQFVYVISNGNFYQGLNLIRLDNQEYFENKSWTMSYSFYTETWVSWHSFLPNFYINGKNSFYSFITTSESIWKHNIENHYQTYYGVFYPHINEVVEVAGIEDSIIEDITLHTDAVVWDETLGGYADQRYTTFNKMMVYNSHQCSGEYVVVPKNGQPNPSQWLFQQIKNKPGEIIASKEGRSWNINKFRDMVVNYKKPLFSTKWEDKKAAYYIDKVVTPGVVDLNKSWSELRQFNDKYVVIRFIFDNFNNVNLTLHYTLETEQPSI